MVVNFSSQKQTKKQRQTYFIVVGEMLFANLPSKEMTLKQTHRCDKLAEQILEISKILFPVLINVKCFSTFVFVNQKLHKDKTMGEMRKH